MAITTRTDRVIGTWVHSETGDRVGPGAYELGPRKDAFHDVAVPFDSGVPRKSVFDVDSLGPGPAEYDTGAASSKEKRLSCRSVFESKVGRFDDRVPETPGPGVYNTRPSWGKQRLHNSAPVKPITAPLGSAMELIRDNNQLAIVFGPSGGKPSIPLQSKTVKADALSAPPKPPPRGVSMALALPRPDLYSTMGVDKPSYGVGCDDIGGAHSGGRSSSNTINSPQQKKEITSLRGETVLGQSAESQQNKSPTFAFASRTERFKDPPPGPGPLEYIPTVGTIEHEATANLKRCRFGSLPLSGSYDNRKALGVRDGYVPKWMLETPPATRYMSEDRPEFLRQTQERKLVIPFGTTSSREVWGSNGLDNPGPGDYDVERGYELMKSKQRCVSCSPFLSLPRQDIVSPSEREKLGPGEYQLDIKWEDRSNKPSRMFVSPSNVKRSLSTSGTFSRSQIPNGEALFCLGPMDKGPVQISKEIRTRPHDKSLNSVFASRTQRFDTGDDGGVGPGQYAFPEERGPGGVILPEGHTRVKRGRRSGERAPGPGQYALSRTFVKKGFSKLFIPKLKK